MNLFYNEVIQFIKSSINVPKDISVALPKNIRNNIQNEFKHSILEKMKNSSVIVVNPECFDLNISDSNDLNILKNNYLPFDNMFIELSNEDIKIGTHYYKMGESLEIMSFVQDNTGILPYLFIVSLDKLPRFYVGCPSQCDNRITVNSNRFIRDRYCLRTPRTAEFCDFGKLGMSVLTLLCFIVHQFNKSTEINYNKDKRKLKSPHPLSSTSISRINNYPKFIYIGRTKSLTHEGDKKGIPKSPHNRRGHYRHYKNGKTIWVKPAKVKGGNSAQKFYKI